MTGNVSRNTTARVGSWSVVHDSRTLNTPWGIVSWRSSVPEGTSLSVRARSSNDRRTWSLWENLQNNAALHATPPGQFLEVEVTMQSHSPDLSPVLYELSVTPAFQANLGALAYTNGFEGTIGSEWSANKVAVTPAGGRRFLGQFSNQTVTLVLNDLPPHAAATVVFDQFVLGTWDGNNTNDGPDVFELNVGGGLRLVHSTFNNGPADSLALGQSYPAGYPGVTSAALTGAAETNSLGFTVAGVGHMDSVYHHLYSFPHTADSLALNFVGSGLSGNLADESWGLDNVRVYLTPREGPPELTLVGFTPHGLSLQMLVEPGWNYIVQGSADLVNWTSLYTNRPGTNWVWYDDAEAHLYPGRFYRALQTP
jgi:hypothetical protein